MPPRGYPGGEILRREDAARQDRARVVFEDRDAVDLHVDIRHVEVTDINAPILVPTGRREGRRRLRVRGTRRFGEPVQLPVARHDPPAGARTQVNPLLLERRVHSKRAAFGILLQSLDRGDRGQIDRAHPIGAGVALVRHSGYSFGDPALQGVVNGVPRGRPLGSMQVGGDTRHAPPFAVQLQHRVPPRGGIGDLVIGREPTSDEGGQRVLGEDAAHGVMARTPPELDATDLRDLMGMEGGMLGFEDEDRALDFLGERAMPFHLRRPEQTGHPFAIEAGRLPVEGALRCAGEASAFGRRIAEEDDGADQFVGALLGGADEQVELLPVVGRIDALPVSHRRPPFGQG